MELSAKQLKWIAREFMSRFGCSLAWWSKPFGSDWSGCFGLFFLVPPSGFKGPSNKIDRI